MSAFVSTITFYTIKSFLRVVKFKCNYNTIKLAIIKVLQKNQ